MLGGKPTTHADLLELRADHQAFREGFDFLDEKRLLLASEILRRLRALEQALATRNRLRAEARAALRTAIYNRGLGATLAHPAPPLTLPGDLGLARQGFLGVTLQQPPAEGPVAGEDAEPAAEDMADDLAATRRAFAALLEIELRVGAELRNLRRLSAEYARTQRRARALEDVILPEQRTQLEELEARLADLEQEEAVRVRLHRGRHR